MTRPLREDGTPYPRKRPVDWDAVKKILAYRRTDRAMIKRGFIRMGHFGPWEHTRNGRKIIDAVAHPDGSQVYIKLSSGE